MMIQRPRGTRDFSPEEMITRRYIEDRIRSTAVSFGYNEVATPTFEDAELFIRKSGPEIVKQLYLFQDKAERELVLRPELTAPVIRFYANDLYKLPKPLKIYYVGNCFRYERPQKGRFREFWQYGAELIGTDTPEGIAELITLACTSLSNVGLKTYELRIGYLEILKTLLSNWEIFGNTQHEFFTALDKGDVESLRIILEDSGLLKEDIDGFFNLVQNKFSIVEFHERKKSLSEQFSGISEYLERIEKVIDFLKLFKIEEFTIDLGIARGLDYYTGIVFEIDVDSLGAEKQVCGGGEYSLDELFKLQGASSSGFAIGFDRVVMAFELENLEPPKLDLDIFMIPLSEQGLKKAIDLAQQLRLADFKVDIDIKNRNMSKNLKYASSRMAKFAVFIGENELKENIAMVREMTSGEQVKVKQDEILDYFKKRLKT
jgi:histidyl-tRNA synthetase